MTAKEYYKSTRMVETRNWTLEMALNFAEEYAEALRKHAVSRQSEQLFCPSCGAKNWDRENGQKHCLDCGRRW